MYLIILQLLDLEKDTDKVRYLALEKLCQSYQHTDEASLSLKYCSDALEISQTADLYCLRAEAYITNSMFEEGMANINYNYIFLLLTFETNYIKNIKNYI